MNLYFDKSVGKLVERVGFSGERTKIGLKRGDAVPLRVEFCEGAVSSSITGTQIVAIIKQTPDGDPLAMVDDWTESDGVYSAQLSTNTTAINDLIAGADSIALLFELTYSEDAGLTWASSQTVPLVLSNDLYKGVEGTPLELDTPEPWLTARAVRHDAAQSLTTGQKTQARTNIEALQRTSLGDSTVTRNLAVNGQLMVVNNTSLIGNSNRMPAQQITDFGSVITAGLLAPMSTLKMTHRKTFGMAIASIGTVEFELGELGGAGFYEIWVYGAVVGQTQTQGLFRFLVSVDWVGTGEVDLLTTLDLGATGPGAAYFTCTLAVTGGGALEISVEDGIYVNDCAFTAAIVRAMPVPLST